MSVLVETREHDLLFDTGGRLSSRSSSAQAAVIPYLRHLGKVKLDRLIISHPESDHTGGLDDLRGAMRVDVVTTAQKFQRQIRASESCDKNLNWQWNGVQFSLLNSSTREFSRENDNSYVLLVSSEKSPVLLPGDIERAAQLQLLEDGLQNVTLLLAPHHGSKTSSSDAFVEALSPQHVVYSVGYNNRFGFPHEIVRQRPASVAAQVHRTERDGLLKFRFAKHGVRGVPQSCRNVHREFWRSEFDLRLE